MDFWVLAAAAGAGYLAKFWQNHWKEKDKLSGLLTEDPNHETREPGIQPSDRKARRKRPVKAVSADSRRVSDCKFSNTSWLDSDSVEKLPISEINVESGEEEKRGRENISVCYTALLPNLLPVEIGSIHGFSRMRRSLKMKSSFGHFVKPLNSLESCILAQLYMEHVEMKEYVFSSFPVPCLPPIRTLVVSDGNHVISRASDSSYTEPGNTKNKLQNELYQGIDEAPSAMPPVPKMGSLEVPEKVKCKSGKGQGGRLSSFGEMVDGKCSHAQNGPSDGSLLFLLGITVGIISSFIANRMEVEKLKELLNQTENLVQDLQEELEMKESLTVKELMHENCQSQDTCQDAIQDRAPSIFSSEQLVMNSRKYTGQESYDLKTEECSESMSKIEAELEAELERLGLNVNTSNLEMRLSDLAEIDPDFVADFATGELRTDMVNEQANASISNHDSGGSSTARPSNYAVSPRELSLHLHEVIQARLEDRVRELEAALQDSQRKVQIMESEKKPWTKFSRFGIVSPPAEERPYTNKSNSLAQPLVMNLSGEALDAYNEAYNELLKLGESDEDSSPPAFENQQKHIPQSEQDQNGQFNGSLPHSLITDERDSRNSFSGNFGMLDEDVTMVRDCDDFSFGKDGLSDSDDESERTLIKQIVEKTKKGFPALLNAQRMLFLEGLD